MIGTMSDIRKRHADAQWEPDTQFASLTKVAIETFVDGRQQFRTISPQEATIITWASHDARALLNANRNLMDALQEQQVVDLIASNIETIKNIHEKTLRTISKMCGESLSAHPHYEDSYPPTLAVIENQKPQPDIRELAGRATEEIRNRFLGCESASSMVVAEVRKIVEEAIEAAVK